ncbi:MAG: hypothetical protein ABJP87_14840 [Bauldia litoralis]|uniref:hypothetical protein n=1 Tax=Bauldia litoralis TaxID=665467 RepID=UPI00329A31F5
MSVLFNAASKLFAVLIVGPACPTLADMKHQLGIFARHGRGNLRTLALLVEMTRRAKAAKDR